MITERDDEEQQESHHNKSAAIDEEEQELYDEEEEKKSEAAVPLGLTGRPPAHDDARRQWSTATFFGPDVVPHEFLDPDNQIIEEMKEDNEAVVLTPPILINNEV